MPGLDIVDFRTPEGAAAAGLVECKAHFVDALGRLDPLPAEEDQNLLKSWLKESSPAYTHPNHPGVIVVPDFFNAGAHREIAELACRKWTRRPAGSNLDLHWDFDSVEARADGQRTEVWDLYEKTFLAGDPEGCIVPLKPAEEQDEEHSLTPLPIAKLLQRLRWTSLGYIYDWMTKTYPAASSAPPIPPTLAALCRTIVAALEHLTGYPSNEYAPEAGVINFYLPGTALHSHQDRSEFCKAPLVSLSLGSPCVFLMGGPTTESEPTAFLLRSGDLVIMSGESRLCFHGVPRVFDAGKAFAEGRKGDALDAFMDGGRRINVNLRQVFPKNSR